MQKIDFVTEDKQLYSPKTKPEIVEVPKMKYLMIDGLGFPDNNPAFQRAFQALYGLAYTIKFMPKKSSAPEGFSDFKVPPPEGLWWMEDNKPFDNSRPSTDWHWTLMLRVPDYVTDELLSQAVKQLVQKRNDDIYYLARLDSLDEGKAVQMLHIGPYATEQESIKQMDALVEQTGLRYIGRHHEIYFGDPRRTAPEKLKTVLRHPVAEAGAEASKKVAITSSAAVTAATFQAL